MISTTNVKAGSTGFENSYPQILDSPDGWCFGMVERHLFSPVVLSCNQSRGTAIKLFRIVCLCAPWFDYEPMSCLDCNSGAIYRNIQNATRDRREGITLVSGKSTYQPSFEALSSRQLISVQHIASSREPKRHSPPSELRFAANVLVRPVDSTIDVLPNRVRATVLSGSPLDAS